MTKMKKYLLRFNHLYLKSGRTRVYVSKLKSRWKMQICSAVVASKIRTCLVTIKITFSEFEKWEIPTFNKTQTAFRLQRLWKGRPTHRLSKGFLRVSNFKKVFFSWLRFFPWEILSMKKLKIELAKQTTLHCVTDYYAHLIFCCKPG